MKFRTKVATVEAWRWGGSGRVGWPSWLACYSHQGAGIWHEGGRMNIPTAKGTLVALVGDWIVRSEGGELRPMKDDQLADAYEPVTDNAPPISLGLANALEVLCEVHLGNIEEQPWHVQMGAMPRFFLINAYTPAWAAVREAVLAAREARKVGKDPDVAAAQASENIQGGQLDSAPARNTGHGHVWPRADGMKARCGGPEMCGECAKDLAQKQRLDVAAANIVAVREVGERLAAHGIPTPGHPVDDGVHADFAGGAFALHPIGGEGVPHVGCGCKTCQDARQ